MLEEKMAKCELQLLKVKDSINEMVNKIAFKKERVRALNRKLKDLQKKVKAAEPAKVVSIKRGRRKAVA